VPSRGTHRAAENPLRRARSEPAASGLSAQPFLSRWLAVTAVLFAISAAILRVRVAMVGNGRVRGARRGAP